MLEIDFEFPQTILVWSDGQIGGTGWNRGRGESPMVDNLTTSNPVNPTG